MDVYDTLISDKEGKSKTDKASLEKIGKMKAFLRETMNTD
jgi:hypothetical protein